MRCSVCTARNYWPTILKLKHWETGDEGKVWENKGREGRGKTVEEGKGTEEAKRGEGEVRNWRME